ncbi:MAG: zinc-binding alcohol dehydrogenase [Spirochaetaceae bacterium]|jgi:2-desacetyl-2-hydroxyethyl bacteriochlorophyllide A dehydrogenase|nr:zinc-binding alcohol dehydrogenase [Spirochaetaceae bacterium]
MLNNKKVVFEKPWSAKLLDESLDENAIAPGQVLLKKRYSIISTGTELACLSGGESWFALPGTPGYSCAAEVVKIGTGITDFSPGDMVFCYGSHTLYEIMSPEGVFLKVPKEIDLKWIPFVRIASIAATAIRASDIEWGDFTAVTGQGLVGNMAMQLAKLQGAKTIAIDIAEKRLDIAKQCGAELVINASNQDVATEIKRFTGGYMASTLIEATGVPSMNIKAAEWVEQNGEMIFLGSPRGKYETDVTPFLNRTHLAAFNVTLKGAHEWRYPVNRTPFVKHSLERNSELIIELISRKRLTLEPLLTEIASPADCGAMYEKLRNHKDQYMGILFDWNITDRIAKA